MFRRDKVIKNANSEQLLELVEKCKGGGKVALPVAIVVMGFMTAEYAEMLEQIAAAEKMEIVDYAEIAMKMRYVDPSEIEKEWKRQINETMMSYKGVIIMRHFGDNVLTRENMIMAAKTGMKHAKVIIVRLGTDSVKGFVYHQDKYHEQFASDSQMAISENINYKGVNMSERFDYYVEMA